MGILCLHKKIRYKFMERKRELYYKKEKRKTV